jgi:hypothetical protein
VTDEPSDQLLDQRRRNRIIDCCDYLSDGEAAVRTLGFRGYFEFFFDWLPYEGASQTPSCMTGDETLAVDKLLLAMREALVETPPHMSEDDFIATKWPQRIQPVAIHAVQIFLRRGRFDEEAEEPQLENR